MSKVAVIGAGSVGIAVAYYLARNHGVRNMALIDSRDAMSLTSAQSGENYRKADAEDAWSKATAFLRAHLQQ